VDETPALANSSQQQQQHSIPGSATGSPQRVANKRSSITVNMPAAGLGQRPPSSFVYVCNKGWLFSDGWGKVYGTS